MAVITHYPSISEASGGPCPDQPPVWSRLDTSAARFPDRLAVASIHQPAGLYEVTHNHNSKDYLRWSYAELCKAVDRFAGSIRRLGVVEGQSIVTYLSNGVEFIISFWAAHKLGCVFAPLSPRSLINEQESKHILRLLKPSLVIVDDDEAVSRLEGVWPNGVPGARKVVVADERLRPSWISFLDVMSKYDPSESTEVLKHTDDGATVAVLFTSGTTSLPKGVPHTSKTLNAFCENLSLGGASEKNIFCSVLPNNHAMGYFYVLHFMMHGGAIIYPSRGFDPEKWLYAIENEKATHTTLVPATLHSLSEAIRLRGHALDSSLVNVTLGGSSATPDNIRFVINELRSSTVSTGFGMTEGSPVWTAPKSDPEDLILENNIVAGHPSPGATVRLCAQHSRAPVPLGEPGELHQTGPGLIEGYLGPDADDTAFYVDDDGRHWFVTGDQAIMHPDGRICITGRYKDIINRGGEKIVPAAMEAMISRVCGEGVQVVGVPDSYAGEVPVVIVRNDCHTAKPDIMRAILTHMGSACVPAEIISLRELGLEEFPTTVSLKVKRTSLSSLVTNLRQDRKFAESMPQKQRAALDSLLSAYSKSTGIATDDLDTTVSTTLFADSITTMRVRDSLRKEFGLTLSVGDMTTHQTIDAQAALLEGLKGNAHPTDHAIQQSQTPPAEDDLASILGSVGEANTMKELISKTLAPRGFSWDADVRAVIPVYDYMQVLLENKIIDTWNFAMAVTSKQSSVLDFRAALKKALANNPVLTSLCVTSRSGDAFYVTIKPSDKLWDLCILDGKGVKTVADVQQLAIDHSHRDRAKIPGPLFRCLVVHVEETNSAAMVMYLHHLVQDASSLRLFYEDINQSLSNPSWQLAKHVDFKAWSDSFQALRLSPAATLSVNYHIKRLSSLHLHKQALYPPAPLPREVIRESADGLDYGFDAPNLPSLIRAQPGVTAALVLKAAIALVNVSRTDYTHAVFYNFEAGRGRFPFVPATVEALESSDVNGPVMQSLCNLVEVNRDETAAVFLGRLQAEQLELTRHAHAPLRRVLEALHAEGNGSDEVAIEAHRSQFVTWVPGFLGEYERLQIAQIAVRVAAGLVVVGGLGGRRATTFQLSLRWDVANFSREKTANFAADLENTVLWLCEERNWNEPVGELLHRLI